MWKDSCRVAASISSSAATLSAGSSTGCRKIRGSIHHRHSRANSIAVCSGRGWRHACHPSAAVASRNSTAGSCASALQSLGSHGKCRFDSRSCMPLGCCAANRMKIATATPLVVALSSRSWRRRPRSGHNAWMVNNNGNQVEIAWKCSGVSAVIRPSRR
ncbi:hypothetical protein D3C72_1846640 [compost metagenome]